MKHTVLSAAIIALASFQVPASADDGAVARLHCRALDGTATVGVRPGGVFTASVSLESTLPIIYNSAIFRMVLSRPGVGITDYGWNEPFVTGGPFDFSLIGVDLPAEIDAETLAGPTYPAGVIDIEFASFLPVGDTGPGMVAEIDFMAPAKMAPGETFFIVALPDTFALGFAPIPTATATVLTVRAIYSPDFDGDGVVGVSDLAVVLAAWGTPEADLDGDGLTNSSDLGQLLASWG